MCQCVCVLCVIVFSLLAPNRLCLNTCVLVLPSTFCVSLGKFCMSVFLFCVSMFVLCVSVCFVSLCQQVDCINHQV